MAPPNFGRSVNPISTKRGGRLCPPNNTGTPEFSDLPTTRLILPSPIFSFVCSFACGLSLVWGCTHAGRTAVKTFILSNPGWKIRWLVHQCNGSIRFIRYWLASSVGKPPPRATACAQPLAASFRMAKLPVLLVLVGHKSYPSPRSANLIGNFLTSNYFHKFWTRRRQTRSSPTHSF